jgi:hypothetical protein
VRHAACEEAREHAASEAYRQGEHLNRKVADCGSRHATAGEEQAMPAARQPPQTASNEIDAASALAPAATLRWRMRAAVMPQRASGNFAYARQHASRRIRNRSIDASFATAAPASLRQRG